MASKRMAATKLTRLEARTRVIQGAGKVAMILCSIVLGLVVVATAMPQRRQLDKLEGKLEVERQREAEIMAQRDYRKIELRALREDPEFLEIHARDRLGYCRPGERVLRFKQDH